MKFKASSATIRDGDSREKAKRAAAALRDAFADFPVKALLYFASPVYDGAILAEETDGFFPGATVFGCSSSGELASGAMLEGSVTAMAFSDEALRSIHLGLAENISTDPLAMDKAAAALEAKMGRRLADLDYTKNVGIILMDGLSWAKENVLDRLGALTDVMFAGGGAGDDMNLVRTNIYCDGRSHPDATLLAVLEPSVGFSVVKTQSAIPSGVSLVPTRVDEEKRIVWEFAGRPAAEAYARVIGVPASALTMEHFIARPLGLMAEGEPYIRSVLTTVEGGGLAFLCSIKENAVLRVLKAGDIVADMAAALEQTRLKLGGISGLIDFCCVLRKMDLVARGQGAEYAALFKDFPAIGFGTYGEAYIGHVNQTSVQLAFA